MFKDVQMHARGSFRYFQYTTSLTLSSSGFLLKFVACFASADVSKVTGKQGENMPHRSFVVGSVMLTSSCPS